MLIKTFIFKEESAIFALKGNFRPNLTLFIFAIRKERCEYEIEDTKYNLNINQSTNYRSSNNSSNKKTNIGDYI